MEELRSNGLQAKAVLLWCCMEIQIESITKRLDRKFPCQMLPIQSDCGVLQKGSNIKSKELLSKPIKEQ